MEYKNLIIGLILIFYGLFKLSIGLTTLLSTEYFKNYIRSFNKHIKLIISKDETISGKMIEITFIIFGVYSLLHGLDKLNLINKKIKDLIDSRKTIYLLYGLIGIFLTFFYSLVVYTDLPINKNKNEINRYKLIGIISGLSFLIMLPIILIVHEIIDKRFIYSHLSLISLILIFVIVYLMIETLKDTQTKKNNNIKTDLISISMIPLNTF